MHSKTTKMSSFLVSHILGNNSIAEQFNISANHINCTVQFVSDFRQSFELVMPAI